MGKNTRRVEEFIEGIPASKLSDFVTNTGKIYSNTDFRLDMQGMTSDKPAKHNLQVQINKQTKVTSLKKAAPDTVATLIVPADGSMSAEEVRQGLIDAILI